MKREMKRLIVDATKVDDVRSPMVIGIRFDCADQDRGAVVREWAKEILSKSLMADSPNFVLLAVSLDACGGHATYRTVSDIPLVDVPCPCGNPNHWLIKYQEV